MSTTPHNHDTFYIRCRGIILHKGKLLVVKHEPDSNYYALPGGHMDYGETPLECIKREILEELGVSAQIGRLFFVNVFDNKPLNKISLEMMFEITNSEDFADLEKIKEYDRSHAYEIADMKFVDKDESCNLLPEFAWEEFVKGNFEPTSDFQTKYFYNTKT